MKDFASVIHVQDGFTAQFIFSALYNTAGCRYFVSVLDGNNDSYMFTMEQSEDKSWKIINAPKVPQWIMETESRLEAVILENMDI
jgi:hypothetical protein